MFILLDNPISYNLNTFLNLLHDIVKQLKILDKKNVVPFLKNHSLILIQHVRLLFNFTFLFTLDTLINITNTVNDGY